MGRIGRACLVFIAFLLIYVNASYKSRCDAGVITTWNGTASTGTWFENINWDNGTPNAPGDIAQIPAGPTVSISLSQSATIGQLVFLGTRLTSINGAGPLVFDQPGDNPALIHVIAPPRSTSYTPTVFCPISFASNETLQIDVDTIDGLSLNGGMAAGSGNLLKTGGGALILNSGNSTWGGRPID